MQIKEWILRKKKRVLLTGILITAVPLAVLAAYVHLAITSAFEKRIILDITRSSDIAAENISRNVKKEIAVGKMFITRPYLLKALQKNDMKEVQRHLKNFIDNADSIERVTIANLDGVQVANFPFASETIGKDFSFRDWYKGVSKSWAPYVSEFYMRTAEPRRYLFAIAVPMRYEGRVIGIFVMQPKADYFKRALTGIELTAGHIHLLDKKGHLIYSSEQEIDKIIDYSGDPVVQKLRQGLSGIEVTRHPETGELVFSAYRLIKELGWGIIVDKPRAVVLAPVRKVTSGLFVFVVVMLLLGGYFSYHWSALLDTTQKLSERLAISIAELQAMNEEFQVMNEELQQQQKEIAQANERLTEVSRAKSDFLANMSHELRTPLNSIIGFSEILEDGLFGSLNEKQKEYIQDVLSSGRHLLQLINDILDLSKVEAGKLELELSRFHVKDILETSITMLKEKAMKQGIRLGCEIEPDADIEIEADERKLKQIIFNLLSNAVKFTPDGGSVHVYARKVRSLESGVWSKEKISELTTQHSELDRNFVEISVADTGVGIKPEDMEKLFKPFSQLESPYEKKYEGTGLGLALTKKLIELHGGKVWVESEFGKGSRFTFTIPVGQMQKPVVVPSEAKRALKEKGRKTALVIDDDPIALSIVEGALKAEGYEVSKASNGADGIEAAKKELPDLIVLDLMMPGMSGFEVLDSLRSDSRLAGVPIAILTSMDLSPEDKKRLMSKAEFLIEKGSLSKEGFLSELKKAL